MTEEKKQKISLWQKWKKLKKRWKFLIITVVVIAVIVVYSNISQQNRIKANREIVTTVRQDIVKEAIRTGQVELQGVVDVKPPISGVISELLVNNGDSVQEGDVLFKVKTDATEAEKAAAWASYLSAKNTYEDAKISNDGGMEWSEFESAKQAMIAVEEKIKAFEEANPDKVKHDDRDYEQLKLEESITRRKLNQATLTPQRIADRQAEAKANYYAAMAAYNATKDGTYRSPINGRIENLGVNAGESVLADVGDKEGTPLFLIVPEGRKTISMQIGPNDANLLQVGQPAVVKSDLVKDASFSAQIVRIDKVGKSGGEKGLTYRAWLELNDDENQLLLGAPVDITIQTGVAFNVVAIPVQAVTGETVTIVNDQGDVLETRIVKTGLKAEGMVEIIEGLSEGELVLVDNNII